MKKFWLPYSMWDMLGIELWLNEMAAQGWALGDWPRFTFIGRVPFLPLDWTASSISLIRLKTENFPGIFISVNPAVRYLYFTFRARSRKKPWTC